jgi:hypothetical protein
MSQEVLIDVIDLLVVFAFCGMMVSLFFSASVGFIGNPNLGRAEGARSFMPTCIALLAATEPAMPATASRERKRILNEQIEP